MSAGTRPSVLISGAAGGIGRATAARFAREGWLVGVYDLDAAGAERTAAELGEGDAIGGSLDVTRPDDWARVLAEFTRASGGRLDLLINNAGILRSGRLADVPIAAHHLTIDVNVKGVINGCHAAYPYLKATAGSGVINLCSASAIYGQAEIASYSASKFAVRGLTEALELEWRKEGIRVQAVWPLWVNTGLLDGAEASSLDTLGVNLTVDDVAEAIYAAARPSGVRGLLGKALPRKVHTAVGLPAKTLATAADLVPSFISREVNRRITRS
ncbi:SDR family oxidoreductase [Nocardioides nematodiphilus]|jgi:NAD(P)-dependent dehydrogenase (short-subunit alcohol dehydrogenase family)|uniref:SDR family oxidoreductase n=1 Tax=Nocardioides nematodiphilus TaxID=2849669 RepID=UPI001CD9D38E|nr:SDR family oxidoreductase [Nocardioides nematodiphilus]MCA1984551.1 SDR family oxidoreductase [Nocardioides nematodiphilus]